MGIAFLSKGAKSHGTHTTRALAFLSPREVDRTISLGAAEFNVLNNFDV
jgi:hypothetical protein